MLASRTWLQSAQTGARLRLAVMGSGGIAALRLGPWRWVV